VPLVSIIIPCHNDGEYLPATVSSAKAQTYPDTQIVIVDDASTDLGTCVLLQQLAADGLTVLASEGRGVSAARNTGIRHCRGEYILPLDADDAIHPTYVSKAVAVLDARPEIGICYCRAELFGLKSGPWRLPSYSLEEMLVENIIFASALFRRSDWEAVGGFDESLLIGLEDHAFWLSLLARGVSVHRLDEVLFRYRVKPWSRTAGLCAGNRAEQAALAVFAAHRPLYERHSDALFLECRRLRDERARLRCSFVHRLVSPLIKLELAARQRLKRFLGRG